MSDFYDRNGRPLDLISWGQLCEDLEYKNVAHDKVDRYEVSTVWLGLNHEFLGGPPLIFETMVFENKVEVGECFGLNYVFHPALDELTMRYSNEAQARDGHERVVKLLSEVEESLGR